MKRFLMVTVIALFVILPLVSFARTAITDQDLNEVTAEAGVSIDFTNLIVNPGNPALTTISWGDTTGFTGYTTPGYFGFSNIVITGNLLRIPSGTMNIDVGSAGTETKIGIVLPPITMGTTNITVWIMADRSSTFASGSQSQGGLITVTGMTTTITGTVAIYAH